MEECCFRNQQCQNVTCLPNYSHTPSILQKYCLGARCTAEDNCCSPNERCSATVCRAASTVHTDSSQIGLPCRGLECQTDDCCLRNQNCAEFFAQTMQLFNITNATSACQAGQYFDVDATKPVEQICSAEFCLFSECCQLTPTSPSPSVPIPPLPTPFPTPLSTDGNRTAIIVVSETSTQITRQYTTISATNSAATESPDVSISWKVLKQENTADFRLVTKRRTEHGYVCIGFAAVQAASAHVQMDIVCAGNRVDGLPMLTSAENPPDLPLVDMFARQGLVAPVPDTVQNFFAGAVEYSDGVQTVSFSRPLYTRDVADVSLLSSDHMRPTNVSTHWATAWT